MRFNLSKSGIGVSTGIPGFRIGMGPRGTQISIGKGGFYYRQTIANTRRKNVEQKPISIRPTPQPTSSQPYIPPHTVGTAEEIGSSCASEMVDTSSESLLAEIKSKKTRTLVWPFSVIFSILLLGLATSTESGILTVFVAILATATITAAYWYDQLKKSVILMYDLDTPTAESFQTVYNTINEFRRCGGKWTLTSTAQVYDGKYHAGASNLISRQPLHISFAEPPYVKTNLTVPALQFRNHTFYFLPDYILIYSGSNVGAISYSSITIESHISSFIEEGSVPFDTKVIGRTWRFVNKNGSPDRRFNNNREIPICEYENIKLTSSHGINEEIQVSRAGISKTLIHGIETMKSSIAIANEAEKFRQIAAQQQPPPRPRHSPQSTWQSSLVQILCCVMVIDKQISSAERQKIYSLMMSVDKTTKPHELDHIISDFIERAKQMGMTKVIHDCLNRVPEVATNGRGNLLLKCVREVAKADGKISSREKELCERIERLAMNTV